MTVESDYSHAQQLLRGGRIAEVRSLVQELRRSVPGDARTWSLSGQLAQLDGQQEAAVQYFERATVCAPHDATYRLAYGQSLVSNGRRREALSVAGQLSEEPLSSASQFDALGTLYAYCDEAQHALEMFERSVAADPSNPGFRYNLATAQRMVGLLDEAEANLDEVIARHPNDYSAYYTRSDLRLQTKERNHVHELSRLLQSRRLPITARIALYFALAKELEDLGLYESSFSHLKRGCDLQRSRMAYQVGDDVDTLDRLTQRHGVAPISCAEGYLCDEPIFVIGLPRSGTTLVERILGAHSEVYAAGEIDAFQRQTVRAVQEHTAGRAIPKLEFLERSLEIDPHLLGRRYIEATRPQTGHTRRFIDKTPLNYLYVWLIRRALPNAKIILVRRDPMDSCYALYKSLFSAAYPFSYDLTELGRYYRAWDRLMTHWERAAGDTLMVIRYEDLVSDPESVSRRLIAHCGLEWEENCLQFHRLARSVSTASAVQVRKPIYSTSVGKWRFYADQLAPLRRELELPG
jgi:predicted Zn-dependent protease